MKYRKKIDAEKFMEAYEAWARKGRRLGDAAKMCGLSEPTFSKRLNLLFTTGRISGDHFTDGNAVVLDTDLVEAGDIACSSE